MASKKAKKGSAARSVRPRTRLRWGTGWRPDEPDPRDRTSDHPKVAELDPGDRFFRRIRMRKTLPARADWRRYCPPVPYQGGFNSCAAHVAAALFEYFEKRVHDRELAVSRLFLYKVTKSFLGESGNVGVYIRQTMGVLKLIGVPAERYWPYPDPGTLAKPSTSDPRLDLEPTGFCYAVAAESRATAYYRLDEAGERREAPGPELLRNVKAHVAAGVPVAFGFPLYSSLPQATKSGRIPYPAADEAKLGSHAVVAVGYDDSLEIVNEPKGPRTKGALLILNSWSTDWGEKGYGWLPYDYLTRGDARDFWTLVRAEWIESGAFQLD